MSKYLWIKGKRYYYYDTYDTWRQAYAVAKAKNKKNPKNKYYIQKVECGYVIPKFAYKLYMTKFGSFSFW